MKNRDLVLFIFELKKILGQKKSFLFLLTLNIIPIMATVGLIILFVKCYSFGLPPATVKGLFEAIKVGFKTHYTLFACLAPFILALIIGDSFCTEFNKGYMKMLLLTPIKRIDIILAKSLAILTFLIIATLFGGVLLQCDLILTNLILNKIPTEAVASFSLISVSSAFKLLLIAVIGNLLTASFLVFVALFFESATVMAVSSSFTLMIIFGIHLATPLLTQIYKWLEYVENINFTRHLSTIFSPNTISQICDGKMSVFTGEVFYNCMYALLWSAIFFALSTLVFSRKHILH